MKPPIFRLELADPHSQIAQELIEQLSAKLAEITGDSGKKSADPASLSGPGSAFVLAYDQQGQAVGCGGWRRLAEAGPGVAELKRMYAQAQAAGAGSAILQFLEQQARLAGYRELWLETRRVNQVAVNFYRKHGYLEIPNYGSYRDQPLAICLAKVLN